MATVNDWNAYINVVHELALVEYDLRELVDYAWTSNSTSASERILFERFGVG